MLKIGIFRLFALVLFGLVVPFGVYRLSRLVGVRSALGLAVVVGLGYGAVKADHPWSGDGLLDNLTLMATSALIVLVYAALAVGAAAVIAKAASNLRL